MPTPHRPKGLTPTVDPSSPYADLDDWLSVPLSERNMIAEELHYGKLHGDEERLPELLSAPASELERIRTERSKFLTDNPDFTYENKNFGVVDKYVKPTGKALLDVIPGLGSTLFPHPADAVPSNLIPDLAPQVHTPSKPTQPQRPTDTKVLDLPDVTSALPMTRTRTTLNPDDEDIFQEWYADIAKQTGMNQDPDAPQHKYDMRAFWKSGQEPQVDQTDIDPITKQPRLHFSSEFKDDDHPNRFILQDDGNLLDTKHGKALTSPEEFNTLATPEQKTKIEDAMRAKGLLIEEPSPLPDLAGPLPAQPSKQAPAGFLEQFGQGAKGGAYSLGSAAAGSMERLQSPEQEAKGILATVGSELEQEAQKYAPAQELANQPWYQRLTNPDYLGNLLGNVAVQTAPSLGGAVAGGLMTRNPAGAAAGMLFMTYLQQSGESYRQALAAYQKQGLSEQEAHAKAYTTSGFAGLISGTINALAIPASLVAPFTRKITNLALQYVLNVGVDVSDQITQNVLAKGTYKPEQEILEGVPEAVAASGLLSAPETMVAAKSIATGPAKIPTQHPQALPPELGPLPRPAPQAAPKAPRVGDRVNETVQKLADQFPPSLEIQQGPPKLIKKAAPQGEARPLVAVPEITPIPARPAPTMAPEMVKPTRHAALPPPEIVPPGARTEATSPTVEEIHAIADAKGIPWDDSRPFMDFTEEVTGKRHLDDLDPHELTLLATVLENAKARKQPEGTPDLTPAPPDTPVDLGAHIAATSPTNALTEPTQAQKGRGGVRVKIPQETRDEAVRLYQAGLTQDQAGAELGISGVEVLRSLRSASVPARPRESLHNKKPQQLKEEAIRLYAEEKKTVPEVAKRLNIGNTTITRWVKQAKVGRSQSEALAMASAQGRRPPRALNIPWQSSKTNKWEFADSKWEAVRMSQLDADESVKSWTKLAERVPYTDAEGKQRHYAPDFLVEYSDGRSVVEEIKPEFRVNDHHNVRKANAAREFFKAKNIDYRVVTEKEIGTDDIEAFEPEGFAKITEDERDRRRLDRRAKAERDRRAKRNAAKKAAPVPTVTPTVETPEPVGEKPKERPALKQPAVEKPPRVTAQDYLNEPINFGGETVTRGEAIQQMKAEGLDQKAIDAYMMGQAAAKTTKATEAKPTESASLNKQEPWKMTAEQIAQLTDSQAMKLQRGFETWQLPQNLFAKGKWGTGTTQSRKANHKIDVRFALSEGKPVPPEVLADYPGLQTKEETQPDAPTTILANALRSAADQIEVKPEQVAASKKPKKEPQGIQDVGQKIGGARKDKWAERGLTIADLEGMTGGEEAKFIVKHNIWKPDYTEMVQSGAEPKAAALVKIIYDQLAAKPAKDTPEGRRHYLTMMGHVKDVYAEVKTVKDVEEARRTIFDQRLEWQTKNRDAETRAIAFSVYKGRSEPFHIGYSERARADKMVAEGFPTQAPWTRRYVIRDVLASGLTDEGARFYAGRILKMEDPWGKTFKDAADLAARIKASGLSEIREKASGGIVAYRLDKASAETEAKRLYENKIGPTGEGIEPVRPHLDELKREGEEYRQGKDVAAEDFRKAFGFRGVEFGNWAASDERQKHVNQAYDGLMDMANVLGMPPQAISLNGTLGLAFGARGGGHAAAHYEPSKLVINITKINGPGSLAHEFGHALDHYFGELDKPDAYKGAPKSVSGWRTMPRYGTPGRLANLRPEMAKAFDDVMTALFTRNKTKADAVRERELHLERIQADLADAIDRLEKAKAKPVADRNLDFITRMQEYVNTYKARAEAAGRGLADLKGEEKPTGGYGKIDTSYYKAAQKLSGKTGDYWKRPTEMFARAFESYVFDRLGRQSDYLVHGVEEDTFTKEKGYKENPYPAGVDRQAINGAFNKLFDTMQTKETPQGVALFERREEYTPTFYSQVSRVLEQKMPNRANFEHIKGILSPNNGVKPDELKWMGMDDYLKTKDYFTKQEVLDFVKANQVQVQEVEKGAGLRTDELQEQIEEVGTVAMDGQRELIDAVTNALYARHRKQGPDIQRSFYRSEAMQDVVRMEDDSIPMQDSLTAGHRVIDLLFGTPEYALIEHNRANFQALKDLQQQQRYNKANGDTKFSQWQLPGGTNYRELLLTLPGMADEKQTFIQKRLDEIRQRLQEIRDKPASTVGKEEQRLWNEQDQLRREVREGGTFASSHFSEPNILAHVRFNTRTDANGKRVLFLEEVQSDWHQKGKREGYKEPALTKDELDRWHRLEERKTVDEISPEQDAERITLRDKQDRFDASASAVPSAPFKKTWHELALKRMLRYAAEQGYDKLAWTTGAHQAERYDLSKQVKLIDYRKTSSGNYMLGIVDNNGDTVDLPQDAYPADELENVVGKEIAQKIINGEGQSGGGRMTLRGLDLKVGGEGMKGFYDLILPAFLNKYAKKWGARVGTTNIGGTGREQFIYQGPEPTIYQMEQLLAATKQYGPNSYTSPLSNRRISSIVNRVSNTETVMRVIERMKFGDSFHEVMKNHGNMDLAELVGGKAEWVIPEKTEPVHSLPITESMKSSVMTEGQPLFEKNRDRRAPTMAQFTQAIEAGVPIGNTKQKVIDSSKQFPAEMIQGLAAKPYVQRVSDRLKELHDEISTKLSSAYQDFGTPTFVGLSPDDYYVGVNLRGPDHVIMNPWGALWKVERSLDNGLIVEGQRTEYLAGELLNNLIHELTHQQVQTTHADARSKAFDRQLKRNYTVLGFDQLATWQRRLMQTLQGETDALTRDLQAQVPFWLSRDRLSDEDRRRDAESGPSFDRQNVADGGRGKGTGPPADLRSGRRFTTPALDTSPTVQRRGTTELDPASAVTPSFQRREAPDLSPVGLLTEERGSIPVSPISRPPAPPPPALFNGFDLPAEKTTDLIRRRIQDKFIRVRRTQEAIKAAGGLVPEKTDVYLAEELFHGRVETRLKAFEQTHVKPLIKAIKEHGLTVTQLEDYLYARHAPERNTQIAKINQAFREADTPGSGMTNKQAEDILAKFDEEGLTAALETVAGHVDDLNTERLRVIEDAGLESPETIQAWRETYQYYVPLKTIQGDERPRTGKGFDIRGTESRRALGRKTAARGLLAHTVVQAEETIVRAEKNRVGERFLNLARRYPNRDLWQIDRVVETPYFDKNTGEVRMRKDPKYKLADNVFSVKQDGKAHLITIHDEALANAMKNLGAERSGSVVRMLAAVNRYLAIVNTSGNPEFLLSNFARDVQTAATNLTGEQSVKMAAKVVASLPMAMKGIANEMMGRPSGSWGRTYQDFQNAGGKMGFFGLRNVEEIQREIAKTVERAGKPLTKALSVIRGTRDLIFAANEVVENAVRLSAFKHAVDAGLSTERAASIAKNLTVNFNRKGELGPIANALWLFYNAGLQGSVRMIQALKSRKVQGIALGIVLASVALNAMNRLLGGEDDDKVDRYDKVPDGIKERNLLVMRPDGSYYKLPLPYGYNVFHVLGAQLEAVLNGKRPPMEGAVTFMVAALNAFNPLGGDKSLIQTVSPTITDPIVELAINRDWSGKPIKPEQSRFELKKPESQLYWNRVSPMAKQVAELLNDITGGNTIRPGAVDVSPEVLDYLVGEVAGGAGAFVNRVANAAIKLSEGKEIPLRKVPFVRVFAGDQPEHRAAQDFFTFSEEVKHTMAEYEAVSALKPGLTAIGESPSEFKKAHGVMLSLRGPLREAEHDLHKLSAQRQAITVATIPQEKKDQALEELTDRIDARRKEFNRLYRVAQEEQRPASNFSREEALLKRRLEKREQRVRDTSRRFMPPSLTPRQTHEPMVPSLVP